MRKPSKRCLPILALLLLLLLLLDESLGSADASNDDESKSKFQRLDLDRTTTTTKNNSEYNNNKSSSTIKGSENRQLFLEDAPDIPIRKRQPAVSKDDLKFPYRPDWKDKFLFPPSTFPTPRASVSNPPTGAPSAMPSRNLSLSSAPSEVPSLNNSPSTSPSSSPTKTIKYVPGKLANSQNRLRLSEGLQSRIIARTNQKVVLADGSLSVEEFHSEPDGAAVFNDDPDSNNAGGWIYVSNSEQMQGGGGVGAIVFDKNGQVINYKPLLRGTSRNCSGGKTPWNTWVSCEEWREGKIWQIDPQGIRPPEVTSLSPIFGDFESFAYDIRDWNAPRFFVTEDNSRGALRRFTPSNPNWEDPWTILHGDGTLEYLVLVPLGGDREDTLGEYYWTTDLNLARANAEFFYRYTEGLDVYINEMFIVSKTQKSLFILDLDGNTYRRYSTNFGLFDGQPDQMKRLIKDGPSNVEFSSTFDANGPEEEPLLYFCEDSGQENGIHARDANGWFYTILESAYGSRETSGLAFSPDGKHMYFSYQLQGIIFDVWREDGLPFYGKTLDVHYHQQQGR